MKKMFFTMLSLFCLSAVLNALDIPNMEFDKEIEAKVAATVSQAKKTNDAGIIRKEHIKYMGSNTIIGLAKTGCYDEAQADFLKNTVAKHPVGTRLDGKTAVLVTSDVLFKYYMPRFPEELITTIYDPDSRKPDEMQITKGIMLGLVYPTGDAFVLSEIKEELRSQFRIYHYKANTNAPYYIDLSGYNGSVNYILSAFKKCHTTIAFRKGFIDDEYENLLERANHKFAKVPSYAADYYTGDEFRARFIGQDKLEDRYPKTFAEEVVGYLGIKKDRKTDIVIKNVVTAKRVSNTSFLTLSNIKGTYFIHRVELGKGKRFTVNVDYDDMR